MNLLKYKRLKIKFIFHFITDIGKYKSKKLFKTVRNYSIIFLLVIIVLHNAHKPFMEMFSLKSLIITYIISLGLSALITISYRALKIIAYFRKSSKQRINSDFIKAVTVYAVGYRKKNKITVDEYLFILDNMKW